MLLNEKLEFIIEIATLIVAIAALWNIKIAKDAIKIGAERDSIKYSAEQVKFFLNVVVKAADRSFHYRRKNDIKLPKYDKKLREFTWEELSSVLGPEEFETKTSKHFEMKSRHSNLNSLWLEEWNLLEIFATPFICKVADEKTAFGSVGSSFCDLIECHWLNYPIYRSQDTPEYNHYSNTIKLYQLWKDRIDKFDLEKTRGEVEERISKLTKDDIRVIGT